MDELKIILTDFEGPLDLLLHLIKQSKIDIYDIPISEVTSQYISFLDNSKKLQLDIAGDYLVMASTLMSIKSKLLLPMTNFDDDEPEEVGDPRDDLVAQLLTYQTFKKASKYFEDRETGRRQSFSKEISIPDTDIKPFLQPNSVLASDLAFTMADILNRQEQRKPITETVENESLSIEEAQFNILDRLKQGDKKTKSFRDLLINKNSIDEVVTTFMATLELMKSKEVSCEQESFDSDLLVILRGNSDAVSS
ncbi:segregation and condensation protein A [Companilactobacillus sp. RD055328]|uniref:segregation and condensation protein A n=1 Tax=Companilactobacillus sp. RD055328 TaxID=2916634 RepID=UPI001FC8B517|nr:segregation/condensation protein A [Companilactobacillus sp. RD055328]GKQ42741.1 segregation and condensation protein A [Companilactobacillus sp. RD055328]